MSLWFCNKIAVARLHTRKLPCFLDAVPDEFDVGTRTLDPDNFGARTLPTKIDVAILYPTAEDHKYLLDVKGGQMNPLEVRSHRSWSQKSFHLPQKCPSEQALVRGRSHKYPLNGLQVAFCCPKTSCMK